MGRQVGLDWALSLAAVGLLGWIDWWTGWELNFFLFYFAPVAFAAWRRGMTGAVVMPVVCSLAWSVADVLSGHTYSSPIYDVWNTVIRLCSFLAIGLSVQKIRALISAEAQKSQDLERSLSEVKVLSGLLPICAQCKSIRDEDGRRHSVETYVTERSSAEFTHSYCPKCAAKLLDHARLRKETEK